MKVLLFTPSYQRPYMLRQCMLNTKNQSYTDLTHSIGIMYDNESDIANYEALFEDIIDQRFVVQYHKNSSTHTNAITTISQCPSSYDLYVKMDDDDIYKKDYVKTIVDYFQGNQCDILSSYAGYQLNNHFMSKGKYGSLGGDFPGHHFLMPGTLAFSRKAYEILLNIQDNTNIDDIQWREAWSKNGLKDHNVDNANNFIWHIHGRNLSVANWFRSK
ncbi:glycosyltransferase [Rossellomorea aquimaris]|uniref:glycosyltransferase n=1 Tax=Rossellomorea aquimaris TaxID=189382 RepID=UPI001CD60E25|nr:glycosyltransferase [Rossellomorea aquimaris]MCA1055431.1 glycosyltransferase [Rossellomorea aquimaris]